METEDKIVSVSDEACGGAVQDDAFGEAAAVAATGNESDREAARPEKPQKYIGRYEMISYIVGTCSLSAFMGLVNNYRGDYLNNVIISRY